MVAYSWPCNCVNQETDKFVPPTWSQFQRRLAAKLSETAAKKKPVPQKTKSSATKTPKQPGRKLQSPKTSKTAVPVITISARLREKADQLQKQLHKLYPRPEIPLTFTSNFQLLIAVMLSAQVFG